MSIQVRNVPEDRIVTLAATVTIHPEISTNFQTAELAKALALEIVAKCMEHRKICRSERIDGMVDIGIKIEFIVPTTPKI